MAKIFPFKAVRPRNGDTECFELLFKEEYSAAGSSPEIIDAPLSVQTPKPKKFDLMQTGRSFEYLHKRYVDFKSRNILVEDAEPAVYIHRIKKEDAEFTGIIVATSIEDYQRGAIVKHEDTIRPRVERFKEYLSEARFTTEPVLLTCSDNTDLDNWIAGKTIQKPDYVFETVGHDSHDLWKIDNKADLENLQQIFAAIPNLYIADGHHRCASSALLKKDDPTEKTSFFMSFVIPESQLKIFGFDWIIKGLNGHSEAEFINDLSQNFDLRIIGDPIRPVHQREFGMYLHGKSYLLTPKETDFPPTIQDPHILLDTIIRPILGIDDIRNDERIAYEPGKNSINRTIVQIDDLKYDVAFFLCPPKFSGIKTVADAKLTMPPKSTYIEPKFRNALVVYEL